LYCVVPENIHTPHTEGIGNSREGGGSQRPKYLKQCVKLYWDFQRSRFMSKSLPWGRYGYFLEVHISVLIAYLHFFVGIMSSPDLKNEP